MWFLSLGWKNFIALWCYFLSFLDEILRLNVALFCLKCGIFSCDLVGIFCAYRVLKSVYLQGFWESCKGIFFVKNGWNLRVKAWWFGASLCVIMWCFLTLLWWINAHLLRVVLCGIVMLVCDVVVWYIGNIMWYVSVQLSYQIVCIL